MPLALSFDTGWPLALNVADIAAALGVMTGVDPAGRGHEEEWREVRDRLHALLESRCAERCTHRHRPDFMGQDPDVDRSSKRRSQRCVKQGATVVDVRYPKWLLAAGEFYNAIRRPEFAAQITDYLGTLKPGFPRSHKELMETAQSAHFAARSPRRNQSRWTLFRQESG